MSKDIKKVRRNKDKSLGYDVKRMKRGIKVGNYIVFNNNPRTMEAEYMVVGTKGSIKLLPINKKGLVRFTENGKQVRIKPKTLYFEQLRKSGKYKDRYPLKPLYPYKEYMWKFEIDIKANIYEIINPEEPKECEGLDFYIGGLKINGPKTLMSLKMFDLGFNKIELKHLIKIKDKLEGVDFKQTIWTLGSSDRYDMFCIVSGKLLIPYDHDFLHDDDGKQLDAKINSFYKYEYELLDGSIKKFKFSTLDLLKLL